jgi:hypothetical protein
MPCDAFKWSDQVLAEFILSWVMKWYWVKTFKSELHPPWSMAWVRVTSVVQKYAIICMIKKSIIDIYLLKLKFKNIDSMRNAQIQRLLV